jgi:hypothetical protein
MNYRVPQTCIIVEGDISPDGVCDKINCDPYTVGEGE